MSRTSRSQWEPMSGKGTSFTKGRTNERDFVFEVAERIRPSSPKCNLSTRANEKEPLGQSVSTIQTSEPTIKGQDESETHLLRR